MPKGLRGSASVAKPSRYLNRYAAARLRHSRAPPIVHELAIVKRRLYSSQTKFGEPNCASKEGKGGWSGMLLDRVERRFKWTVDR